MEIRVDTRYLTQEEFSALTQILVNVGVRQKLSEINAAASTQRPEKKAVSKKQNKKKNGRKKKIKYLTEEEVRAVHSGVKAGDTVYQIAVKSGLTKKQVQRTIYRMQFKPSNLMLKVMGKK